LFAVELAVSVLLVAASALSEVALRRVAADAGAHAAGLELLQDPQSRYRSAATLLRQLCLMGGTLLWVLIAQAADWQHPVLAGLLLGTVIGVLGVETVLSRMLALRDPRRALRVLGFLAPTAYWLLYPVVRPLHLALDRLAPPPLPEEEREDEQEQEVEALIEVGEREGILEAEQGAMMRGVAVLGETHVREIMTPRTDLVALPVETSVAEARRAVMESGHSRLPVYRESIDNVVGVLHARDLFRAWERAEQATSIAAYLRPPVFVPETMTADALLDEMRVKTHVALVVDEFGGVSGVVTLEDLLEEIVGEIRDEHEPEPETVRQEPDGAWVLHATAHVEQLEELFDVEFADRDFDTVGGLVVAAFGRVPAVGESLETHGLWLEVLAADPRRVHRVRVRRGAEVP
ncbi:MAG TPA: hemolysin family protein, partial [Candidatus Polarisedimenticolaceae bacterium]|nr:hemolysin family protein [Candidatus Polarisedimenticolaceae bacterium]